MSISRYFLIAGGILGTVAASAREIEKKIPGPDAFFDPLRTVKSLFCSFSQKQEICGLTRPILLDGSFCMNDRGDLAWIVQNPIRFYCIIRRSKLTAWDIETGKKQQIDLKKHPAFSVMIDMMKNFFAGKISVTKDYKCTIVSALKILLEPLSHCPMAGTVSKIEITLSGDRRSIKEVKIFSSNGDCNTICFKDIKLDVQIPESVWEKGVWK